MLDLVLGQTECYLESPYIHFYHVGYCLSFLLDVTVFQVSCLGLWSIRVSFGWGFIYMDLIFFSWVWASSFPRTICWWWFLFSRIYLLASLSNAKWWKLCVLMFGSSILSHWSTYVSAFVPVPHCLFFFFNCIYFLLFCAVFYDSLGEIYWNTKRDETFNLCPFSLFSTGVLSQKALPTESQPFILWLSCVSFIVLTFIFRLMIHCESTFIYEVKVQFHMSQWNHPVV